MTLKCNTDVFVYPLGHKDEENKTIVFSISPMANCPYECDAANQTSLNKLANTRVFVAAENGSVEVLELVALFLLKTGTFGAENW